MVKTITFWPWWEPFNSFCFETLSFFPLSPFFLFAMQKSGVCNVIKKETPAQVFYCEFCTIFKSKFFKEPLLIWSLPVFQKLKKKLPKGVQKNSFLKVLSISQENIENCYNYLMDQEKPPMNKHYRLWKKKKLSSNRQNWHAEKVGPSPGSSSSLGLPGPQDPLEPPALLPTS